MNWLFIITYGWCTVRDKVRDLCMALVCLRMVVSLMLDLHLFPSTSCLSVIQSFTQSVLSDPIKHRYWVIESPNFVGSNKE